MPVLPAVFGPEGERGEGVPRSAPLRYVDRLPSTQPHNGEIKFL